MWLSEEFKKWNIEEEIKKIEQKTCLVQGEDDQYGSSMQVIKASELNKAESEIHFIKNCKHSPHLEKEELIEIIKTLLTLWCKYFTWIHDVIWIKSIFDLSH